MDENANDEETQSKGKHHEGVYRVQTGACSIRPPKLIVAHELRRLTAAFAS